MNFNSGVEKTELVPWVSSIDVDDFDIPHVLDLAVTASLSFTQPPKPVILSLELHKQYPELFDKKAKTISGAQIEAILLIVNAFSKPLINGIQKGFFLGDQTGVGKTRTLAAVIHEILLRFGLKKALWITSSLDLESAVRREFKTIKFPDNVPILSYGAKQKGSYRKEIILEEESKGVVFTTYSALRSGDLSLCTILTWLGRDFKGVVVLDESHFCKKRNKTSRAIKFLQRNLPYAKIVYATATVGTSASHLWCMDRLMLWGKGCPFKNNLEFEKNVERWGINGMELVAHYLQKQGSFIARQLNVKGIDFKKHEVKITDLNRNIYRQASVMWINIYEYVKTHGISRDLRKLKHYWGSHLKFFEALIQTFKAPGLAEIREEYGSDKYSIVVSVQNTGEDCIRHASDAVCRERQYSLCREILRSTLRTFHLNPSEVDHGLVNLSLPKRIESHFFGLANCLGPNPLDTVIDCLGGQENVSEITGRTKYHTESQVEPGTFFLKDRNFDIEKEIELFQTEKKTAAVVSQKGSTGISLHADSSRFLGQVDENGCPIKPRQRVHAILQIPWVAENAMQQIGRTNRSGQSSAPIYLIVSSKVPGEHRFVQSFLERLSKMGAICHGERNFGNNIYKGFNAQLHEDPDLLNEAAKELLIDIHAGKHKKLLPLMTSVGLHPLNFNKRGKIVYHGGSKQLFNRTLGLEIDDQFKVIKALEEKFKKLLNSKRESGNFEPGIKELAGTWTLFIKEEKKIGTESQLVEILRISADRGVSWQNLRAAIYEQKITTKRKPIFFQSESEEPEIVCGFEVKNEENQLIGYNIYSPWSCEFRLCGYEMFFGWEKVVLSSTDKVLVAKIEQNWMRMYRKGAVLDFCIHKLRNENDACDDPNCRVGADNPLSCRKFEFFILTGDMLSVWDTVLKIYHPPKTASKASTRQKIPLQIVRINTRNDASNPSKGTSKHVGIYIPTDLSELVETCLEDHFAKAALDSTSNARGHPNEDSATEKILQEKTATLAHFQQHGELPTVKRARLAYDRTIESDTSDESDSLDEPDSSDESQDDSDSRDEMNSSSSTTSE